METDVGFACGACDAWSPLDQTSCPACGHDLTTLGEVPQGGDQAGRSVVSGAGEAAQTSSSAQLSEEELMDQARNYVCNECSTAVPSGHKFCGTCGASVPPEVVELRTKYFGTMQTPGKARLILIRGEGGVDGLSYMLQGTEHLAGREDGQILFPEDNWLSPRHANFVYEGGQLVVRDEDSLNGVYVRVRAPVALTYGDTFLCGEQLFRIEPAPRDTAGPSPDQTYFYSSPRKRYTFKLVQLLTGGATGLAFCATGASAQIGREECDLNFPTDVYMSGTHAKLEQVSDGVFNLIDSESKNGSYVRITAPARLQHGAYLFLGRELLRVEMTA
jgi:pSer/pThr/pTyr-binding forkhead associated (FHA) protein/RNA polymerase subunit RPABC4/transcription elongation factor Spt4